MTCVAVRHLPDTIRRHELSAKISAQLGGDLNTVIPVAAGVRRELDGLLKDDRANLSHLVSALRRIPPDTLTMLLDAEEFFRDFDFPESPVGPAERAVLLGEMRWGVFATIARIAADRSLDLEGVERRLQEVTGFGPLWEVLERHFIQRGHILRCYRIAYDAQQVLNELRYTHLPERRRAMRREAGRLEGFLGFVRRFGAQDPETARDLEDFVLGHLDPDRKMRELELLHAEIEAELGALLHRLTEHNRDFEALQKLEDAGGGPFSSAELAELKPLFGLYGAEVEKRLPPGSANTEYVGWRQMHWGRRKAEAPYGTVEHDIADQAYTRYGLILEEILG